MDSNNKKVLTMAYMFAAFLIGYIVSSLITILSAASGTVAGLAQGDFVRHGIPVIAGAVSFFYFQFSPKINVWGDDVVNELRKVVWRSAKETAALTWVVCIILIVVGLFLSIVDFTSTKVVNYILSL